MNEHQDSRSVATLLSDLAQQVTTLLQTEARLLRAEMSDKVSNAGAVCLLAALIVLLQALVIALANAGLGAGWSSLAVGVVVAVIGVILLRTGSANLSPSQLNPDRTEEQFKRDVRVIKEQLK
jgi:hypothetical protein